MQIFGNRSTFAVCYELDQNYNGVWLFGKFCYWIGDVQVGDYEIGTSLRDILFSLRTIVRDNGHREHLSLFELPAEDLLKRLDDAMYGDKNSEYEHIALDECWARFQIHFLDEIFRDWKVYLVDRPPDARIVYSHLQESIVEVRLTSGVFDQAITDVFNCLFDIYNAENEKLQT